MATTIVTKNSSTASAVPTAGQLVQGELAVNVADKKLYTEDNAGSIIVLADGVKLAGIEALADVTDTANVTAAGALMDSELTNITAVKALNQGVATTDSPTFAGATLTTADINAGTIDGTVIGGSTAAAGTFTTGQFNTSLNVDGTVTADGLTVDGSLGSFAVQSSGAEVHFSRNDNNDILANGGTSASFTIGANNNLTFKTGATLTQRLQIASNGNLSLYEDTGTTPKFFWDASAEDLQIGGNLLNLSGVSSGTTGARLNANGGGMLRLASGGVDALYVVDGGNVGIGTSSPAANRSLHVSSAPQNQARFERTGASTVQIEFQDSTTTNQPSLGGDGDSLTFRTSFTERLRIDSSGNVGIGRTPDTVYSGSLQLALGNASQLATSTAGNPSLTITDNSYLNASGNHVYKTTNPSTRLEQYNGTLTFSNAASGTAGATISYAERMRIDASGNVGIGTSASLQGQLNVGEAASGDPSMYVFGSRGAADNLSAGHLTFRNVANGVGDVNLSRIQSLTGTGSNQTQKGQLAFSTNDGSSLTERMRIDSSGNVLVGTTTTDGGYDESDGGATTVFMGASIGGAASGTAFVSRRAAPLQLNRQASDGDIAVFRKNGTTVGSIGTSAETMYVSSAQAGGMKFTYLNSTNALMIPVTTAGANADATHDLGYSSSRFRDLYLSGGVYLGGTGAANKLDDFEEGTWTPNQGAGLTVVGAFQSEGYYTKIGNLVTISGFVGGATSVTCSAGGTLCTNAIFTSAAAGVLWAGSVINWNADSGASCAVQQNTTNVYNGTEVTTSAKISFCVTYRV
jgi:hypothetical protein